MGFMGISHWVDSDCAADFRFTLKKEIDALFKKELKNEANEYNTPGWLNALLIFKSYPHLIHFVGDEIVDEIVTRIKSDNGYLKIKGGKDLVTRFLKLRETKEK